MTCPTCKSLKPWRRGMFFDGPCQDKWHDQAPALEEKPPGPEDAGHDPDEGKARPLLKGEALAEPERDQAIVEGEPPTKDELRAAARARKAKK
jgi:hypothetical protein